MILAGDIGGTKTNLAIFDDQEGKYDLANLMTYKSKDYPDLISIVSDYLKKACIKDLMYGCFAIAGPVQHGVCKATNLPWVVDVKDLSKALGIPHVFLINDLEASAYAIEILDSSQLLSLHAGKPGAKANRAVVSPGTGLGEAGLYWDGKKWCPFATEGGHCEFGPRNELQIDLCRYIYQKFGHASYERVLSGPGLYNIYQFFVEVLGRQEPQWLADEIKASDPAKVITINAFNGKSDLCKDALHLFSNILGSEASNCVLKYMAMGGVYLGGGIPPKILPILKDPAFHEGFIDKGRFRALLDDVPIWVILDDKASLKGSAHYARMRLKEVLPMR